MTRQAEFSEQIPGEVSKKERIENLFANFDKAEAALAAEEKENKNEGREIAKGFLPEIYDDLIALNKRSKEDWVTIWIWNPDGELTEQEFNALNLRRKLLSNAVGIMTASGEIRHDLNEI